MKPSLLEFINYPYESIKKRQSKIKKIFSKITKDSSSSNSSSSNNLSLSSSEELNRDNSNSNEAFNSTLKMKKKLFIRPQSMNNVYKEEYNYLLKSGIKTLYSSSSNHISIDKEVLKRIVYL